jgi:hypothetical protein
MLAVVKTRTSVTHPAEAVYRLDILEPLLEVFGKPIFP